jgi:3-hydroxyacyl-[acyl-carrier-protein] dehydratase
MIDSKGIMKIIPHRYPFLLVDRLVELEPGKRAVGLKNVSVNEPFFQGHFPGAPVMPGVLILEALAQVGACARFKRLVVPGDQLTLSVELLKLKGSFGKAEGKALVGEELAVYGELLFAVQPRG